MAEDDTEAGRGAMPMDSQALATAMKGLYLAGQTLEEIGKRHGFTRQRVRKILGPTDNATELQARSARRGRTAKELAAQVEAFLAEHRHTIEALAASGSSRTDVEARFFLLAPTIPTAVVREGIDSACVLFVGAQEFNFSPAVIESAVWFVLARSLNLSGDRAIALREVDPRDAGEVTVALRESGLNAEGIASVLCLGATARAHASEHTDACLTKQRYEEVRRQVLDELNMKSGKGSAVWPPTSQTVMKRLGGGYWTDALINVGLAPGSGGRARGSLMFRELDYKAALDDYVAHAIVTGQSSTYQNYERWVEAEDRAGRRRPSPPAVRDRYGTWTNAVRMVATSGAHSPLLSKGLIRRATPLSTVSLHHAQGERERFLVDLHETRPAEASTLIERFVRSFVQEFEFRRRDWLRAAVSLDGAVVRRLLAAGGLPREQREALTRTPPGVDAALTDRYIDQMLSKGDPRQTNGWLRADAQAELDALPEEVILQFSVLRAIRNYLTHDSEEARVRLKAEIIRLACSDPRFELHQSLTRRVLIDWLRTAELRRIRLLSDCVPAIWRAMFIGETVLRESPTIDE